jgi:hypothetical protein
MEGEGESVCLSYLPCNKGRRMNRRGRRMSRRGRRMIRRERITQRSSRFYVSDHLGREVDRDRD